MVGKNIMEVGVEDLVLAGLTLEEARGFYRELMDSIAKVKKNVYGFDSLDPKKARELWRELTNRRLLKPWHPHTLHQLLYYSVYNDYDESVNGPPPYWFPSL